MSFPHRILWAWLGSALPLVAFALASQPSSLITVTVVIGALKVVLGYGLLSALIVAWLIRTRPVAMLLTAQLLTTLFVGLYWKM